MSRAILITGATGQQGGAVLNALIARQPSDFLLLAVTRNAQSPSAKRLAAKSPSVRLVEGDLNNVPGLVKSATKAAGTIPLWGVYSVQVSMGSGVTLEGEVRQGKAMIDESIKAGIKHFVYSSVDRGGNERSWENPTPVPHFKTKHEIEHHLQNSTAPTNRTKDTTNPKTGSTTTNTMGWTILRPAIFMDNLAPGFAGKVFLTMLRDTMKEKPLQWVATKDIGRFVADAFHNPDTWKNRATGLAGDELTFSQLSLAFQKVTGKPVGTTVGLLGKALKHGMPEMGKMVEWFKDEGYGADILENKRAVPDMMTMEAWLKESAFVKQA